MQGFRGNCGFPGKLGMCPSLAEPDSGGIPKSNLHTLAKSEAILPNHTQSVSQESNNNKHTKEDSHNRNPLFFCIFTLSELVSEREPVHDCIHLSTAVWCCMFLLCKILSTMS